MYQQVTDQTLVIRFDRPDEYPPAIAENEMPLPLRRIRANSDDQFNTPLMGRSVHRLLLERFQETDEIAGLV
jgi:hypothetical protein